MGSKRDEPENPNREETIMNVQPKSPRPPLNGVDTPSLINTINFVAGQPELARFQFRAANEWIEGTHSRTSMSGFFGAGGEQKHVTSYFADGDHPTVLCGGDRAPTPVEWLLHALATCLTAGIGNIAAARGIKLNKVRSFVEGDIDLRGILGISDEVRNGYRNISIRFEIEGDAPPEKLQQLLDQARDRSAVFDVLTNGVPGDRRDQVGPVDPSLARPGAESRAAITRNGAFHVHDRRRRHRRRPGRACHGPVPLRPLHRPRCVRARQRSVRAGSPTPGIRSGFSRRTG